MRKFETHTCKSLNTASEKQEEEKVLVFQGAFSNEDREENKSRRKDVKKVKKTGFRAFSTDLIHGKLAVFLLLT